MNNYVGKNNQQQTKRMNETTQNGKVIPTSDRMRPNTTNTQNKTLG